MATKTFNLTPEQANAVNEFLSLVQPLENKRQTQELSERLREIITKDIERLNPGWKVQKLYITPGNSERSAFLVRPDDDIVAGVNIFFDQLPQRLHREED